MKFKFIIFAILLTSCSDEIYNTYISSAYAPDSSASSVSSVSSTPAPISQSASSYQSSYAPVDMLISFAGHTLAARWSGSTFDFKVISSNRLIIQSGCKYSITETGGIITDHETGESWDSGIRDSIATGGIGFYRAGNLILVTGRKSLYGIPPKGQARVIVEKSLVNLDVEYLRNQRRGPMFCDTQAVLSMYNGRVFPAGTFSLSYELTNTWSGVIMYAWDFPHDGKMLTRKRGALWDYKIGEYSGTCLTNFERSLFFGDHVRVYDRYLFASGSYISPTNFNQVYGSSYAKLAIFAEGPRVYWFDAQKDQICYSTYSEPHIFNKVHIWFTGNPVSGTADDATCIQTLVKYPQATRWRRQLLFVDKNGNLLQKDVLSADVRILLNGATNCSIAIIAQDEIYGVR